MIYKAFLVALRKTPMTDLRFIFLSWAIGAFVLLLSWGLTVLLLRAWWGG